MYCIEPGCTHVIGSWFVWELPSALRVVDGEILKAPLTARLQALCPASARALRCAAS